MGDCLSCVKKVRRYLALFRRVFFDSPALLRRVSFDTLKFDTPASFRGIFFDTPASLRRVFFDFVSACSPCPVQFSLRLRNWILSRFACAQGLEELRRKGL